MTTPKQRALKVARMFATEEGREMLDWMRRHDYALTHEWVDLQLQIASGAAECTASLKQQRQD